MKHYQPPKFSASLLHPRYWTTWFGIGALYLITKLPYSCLYRLGKSVGRLSMRVLKRRVHIAKRNIELCFPEMTNDERDAFVLRNFESTGLAIFETGMAWFWPDRRIKKIISTSGLEHIQNAKNQQQGVLLLGIHFLNLELGARVFGLFNPGIGVYRPNDNPVIDYVQTKGRLKSNKFMIDRKDIRGMIRGLKQGEIIWYAPDHDYGPQNSIFVPFFHVEKTATTLGTTLLVKNGLPAIIPFMLKREEDAQKKKINYRLIIDKPVENYPIHDSVAAATLMNKVIENEILKAPEQYMWLHRRFKTRPEGEKSLYD